MQTEHLDIGTLQKLFTDLPLRVKLEAIHDSAREGAPFIDRISVALFDPGTGRLKTFIDSSGNTNPLVHYEYKISHSSSLQKIMLTGQPRVVNDLDIYRARTVRHARKIREQGYKSSYTFPMFNRDTFTGLIFFNSSRKNIFSPAALAFLNMIAMLVSHTVTLKLAAVQTMLASLKTAINMVHFKDPETANHLERMSRFSRLIARELAIAGICRFDDEFIEHIFLFAPLHDVGKLGIPDRILLKPGKLDIQERLLMNEHVNQGREIIDSIIKNFHFEGFEHIELLRNIALQHHETLDGTGYPQGLQGDQISIEAQIVAVADIFDALTSERPYKPAWSNDDALRELLQLAESKLNRDCISMLINNIEEVTRIQQDFHD